MKNDEPPGWVLPSWDVIEPVRPVAPPIRPTAILGVSDVTRLVRDAVRGDSRLVDAWVEGEIGRVTISSAGHAYFTLKDERSQLACVFFRDDRLVSPFEPKTGLRVVARGRIDVFEAQGAYQLYVSAVQPAGFGDLALQFEALKARLAAEGLFDPAKKRPVPHRPAVIGVVTSPSGAVWHDICHVLARRWPLARILLAPAKVQGDGAAGTIVRALDQLTRWNVACGEAGHPEDAAVVIILARGGGSLEDLWPFNDERVVRAVAAQSVPVVCGVGHEIDVTLSDFAADLRAPTPSAAAELVTPSLVDTAASLGAIVDRLSAAAVNRLGRLDRELEAERRILDGLRPAAQLAQSRERAGLLLDRAGRAMRRRLEDPGAGLERAGAGLARTVSATLATARRDLEAAGAALAAVGPEATLQRGYAIVRREIDDRIVRDPADAPPGSELVIRVARGSLRARRLPETAGGR